MSAERSTTIRFVVEPSNPGVFFGCLGLLELAERRWNGAEGWFEDAAFALRPIEPADSNGSARTLPALVASIASATLHQVEPDDDYSSPILLGAPFDLRLDWWIEESALKVWAGSMRSVRIARAMQAALRDTALHDSNVFDHGLVVRDVDEPDKKVEPYYFDARRGASALAVDIGFSPDSLGLRSVAFPAVEFLCLVGLQRYRPRPTRERRVFDYFTWSEPLPARIALAAVGGLLPNVGAQGFRFENAFRTDQRKHKAFTPAARISRSEE